MKDATAVAVHAPPRSAYIHVPFCARRCGYCNFTLVAGRDDLIPAYLDAMEQELHSLGDACEVDTLFLGGGTPSRLPLEAFRRLASLVLAAFPLADGHEFTVEANPEDVSPEWIALLAEHGVTRISLGAQSFDPCTLRLLEREHSPEQITESVRLAREQGLAVALDLIFAVPGRSLGSWALDLREALKLEPDHLSTYGLTIEKGALFFNRLLRGEFRETGEEQQRAMYAEAIRRLTAAGFEHYEISNFARPGFRCRHNESYWSGVSYHAAGPGAARYVSGRRETNHRGLSAYLKRVLSGRSPVAESETLSPEDRAREAAVFGLRRLEGIERREFRRRAGFDLDRLLGNEIRRFVELGFLEDSSSVVRLTHEGLFVSDGLWPEFLRG